MITIVEPKEYIVKLWGQQKVKENASYRPMSYILRVDIDGDVLLHNVVTGQLVVLEKDENELLNLMPSRYMPRMRSLVVNHFMVPTDYDEHRQVINLRNILWKMVDAQAANDVTFYTILPTTACNARCWYCFEHDLKPVTMTRDVADAVTNFIADNCGSKPVKIRWFGGEPTLASDRIDQISKGLCDRGINYTSIITSNGYLFDDAMIERAKSVWNTTHIGISVDGTEKNYNRVKAFPNAKSSPYRRVMENIAVMLEKEINVSIRMNFDKETWADFPDLLRETHERFNDDPHLMVYPHQINTDMEPEEWIKMEKWLNQKNFELVCLAAEFGNYRNNKELPTLAFLVCSAGSEESVTIRPDGKIVSCPELLGDDQVKGTIFEGITNRKVISSWKQFADYDRCRGCALFPYCARAANCTSKNRCSGKTLQLERIRESIINHYKSFKEDKI